jgi:hypothetical protein
MQKIPENHTVVEKREKEGERKGKEEKWGAG